MANAGNFKERQYRRQEDLIAEGEVFSNDPGGGYFRGKCRPFVLLDAMKNLYAPIRKDVEAYFTVNKIAWWGGKRPTGHTLSSQMACLNHLFPLRNDKKAVLEMLNGVRDEFEDVLPVGCDADPQYIAFEVVSASDWLHEGTPNRGTNCTSVDALVYAVHRTGRRWLVPIEWKYTESYPDKDKSREDRPNEPKGSNGKGRERMERYAGLLDASACLKHLDSYYGSTYFQEPFYQLMRQTLWAENMVKHRDEELLKAEDYLHIHVVPMQNVALLGKKYKVSGKGMEATWRGMLANQDKYVVVDPQNFLVSVPGYSALKSYLLVRYWS